MGRVVVLTEVVVEFISARTIVFETLDNVFSHPECTLDVCCFAFDGEFSLGVGAATAFEDVGAEFGAEGGGDFARDNLCLVISSGPFAGPM